MPIVCITFSKLQGGPATDQSGSDEVLPLKDQYPGKSMEGDGLPFPSGSADAVRYISAINNEL